MSARPIVLQFDPNARKSFKPTLPFKVNLFVSAPNGRPVDGPEVELKIEFLKGKSAIVKRAKSRRGVASFDIMPIAKGHQFIWLEAKSGESNSNSIFRTMYSWNSPSECHLSASAVYSYTRLRHSKSVELLLITDCDQFYDLHYEVSSRGNIVDFGTRQISASINDNFI